MSSAFDNLCGPGKPLKAEPPDAKEFAGLLRSGRAGLTDARREGLAPESVRGAVQAGEYASSSEIVHEAPRDWRQKRAWQAQELGELRAKVQEGLADIEAGRVHDFDAERIIRKGEEQVQDRVAGSRTS
jgi:antitoxin ParD1/3/4